MLAIGSGAGSVAAPVTACAYGTQSVRFELPDVERNFASGWHLHVSIAGGRTRSVQVDTGSIGFVVGRNSIGPDATGPLEAGRQEYTSDGLILIGHYFRARVTFENGSAPAVTPPIRILGVERLACDSRYPKCSLRGRRVQSVGVLGVGFARKESIGDNAFLAMYPGYVITRDSIVLGLTPATTAGFRFIQLQAKPGGGWQAAPGCYGFPQQRGFEQMCGTMLVDTGLSSMILSRAPSQRPLNMATDIPAGTRVTVNAPNAGDAVLSYQFVAGDRSSPFAPTAIRWSNAPQNAAFINTGRNVLRGYDYLYDAKCGRVGFRR